MSITLSASASVDLERTTASTRFATDLPRRGGVVDGLRATLFLAQLDSIDWNDPWRRNHSSLLPSLQLRLLLKLLQILPLVNQLFDHGGIEKGRQHSLEHFAAVPRAHCYVHRTLQLRNRSRTSAAGRC